MKIQRTSFSTIYNFHVLGRDIVIGIINVKKVLEYGAENANTIMEREDGIEREMAIRDEEMIAEEEAPRPRVII